MPRRLLSSLMVALLAVGSALLPVAAAGAGTRAPAPVGASAPGGTSEPAPIGATASSSGPSCLGWGDPFAPPPLIRVGRVADGVVSLVEELPFDAYVARAFAAGWRSDLAPAALEVGAIVTRQAAWYLTMHGHEGYMLPDGTCYDARDDAIDLELAQPFEVTPAHEAALEATATITLRKTSHFEPFFLPLVREGTSGVCDPGPVSVHPVVPRAGAIACAEAGDDARQILRRYLDPGLTIVDVSEIGGASRYETAVAASTAAIPEGPAGTILVATGTNYPDALAGGPAAARLGGSLLLVPGTSIPPAVAAELDRLEPAAIRVLGGPTVVSDGVLAALRAYSGDVARLSGTTRYETALAISRAAFGPKTERVFVATGTNYPDALAGASAGAALGGPVLLVPAGGAPSGPLGTALAAELRRLAPERIHVLGSSAVVSDATLSWLRGFAPAVDRLAGATRYETAAAITAAMYPAGVERVLVATGDNFPDALAAAPIGGPVLLVPGSGQWPSPAVVAEARRLAATRVTVLGANSIVPDLAVAAVAGADAPPSSGRVLGRYCCTAPPGDPLYDANGIPMTDYFGTRQYNPVQVSQFGLAHFERWLWSGDDADRAIFLKMADWLVERQKPTGLWHYTFAYGGQPVPWWSGMAQGQAVSLLARAYQETGLAAYRASAILALPTMRRPISSAGTASFSRGEYWIEEYIPPYSVHTLNGFMFSIEGLREWVALTGDATAAGWLREALATLSASLPRFDSGRWSYYNLSSSGTVRPRASSIKYHVIHVLQLRNLASTTRDAVLRAHATRWATYAANPPDGIQADTMGEWLVGPVSPDGP